MGWFQELISARLENDGKLLERAFEDLSDPVGGLPPEALLPGSRSSGVSPAGQEGEAAPCRERKGLYRALCEILRWYGFPPAEEPEDEQLEGGFEEELELLLRPSGLSKRDIKLSASWYRNAIGPLLGELNGRPVALIPRFFAGYGYRDPQTGLKRRVTKDRAAGFGGNAMCFYTPLPQRALKSGDLLAYLFRSFRAPDLFFLTLAAVIVSALGLLLPAVTDLIFNRVIPSGEPELLFSAMGMLLGIVLGVFCISICKNTLIKRIKLGLYGSLQAAFMARVLSLPADFFRSFGAGDMAERLRMADEFCQLFSGTLLPLALDLLFSCFFLFQISHYSPSLLLPALGALGFTLVFSVLAILKQAALNRDKLKSHALVRGFEFQLFSGVKKIRLQGAENRAFAQWARRYRPAAAFDYNPSLFHSSSLFLKAAQAASSLVILIGNILIYYTAAGSGIAAGTFMTFSASYGILSAALASLGAAGPFLAQMGPMLGLLEPVMRAVPEHVQKTGEGRKKEGGFHLSGNVELNNVSFRYGKDSPLILDNLSLKIRKGQYAAIVGKTGCGKSTLLRLLLGFEKPVLGSIYYDSRDLEKMDIARLRRNIGVVLQDGKLFQGSLYENISISAPAMNLDEAWDAAERAGLAEDIEAMPMGMFTMVSEGGGGLSGGQRQRLMIARAIASKPRILMLDEATSALDNITQKRVVQALDSLRITRIVVAHRLSTIRSCDRIILLDRGRIAGEGTYDELLARSALFDELVSRQRLDGLVSGPPAQL
ncbi:MAG: ATP-binding cassette domain-containing protein [Treponema sp.]|jgi:NHLM bacteriocin system ABC transporter ATP-binding protein|nr:ATP-binding cassette domain-containing protein [Treponema sp.]